MPGKSLVTFITPPSLFLLDERVFPALGILKVAAVVEQLGYPVEHLDLNGVQNYLEAVEAHLMQSGSMVFAITATTPQMVAVTKIREVIRQMRPDARIILGGPHPTLVHASNNHRADLALGQLLLDFDTVIAGDGEIAIVPTLQGRNGLINADDPKSSLFLTSQDLPAFPLPARHLIDLDSYHYWIDGRNTTPLISNLGCPFGCNFCAGRNSGMLRRVRMRSASDTMAELIELERMGYTGFMFFDDELNVNRQLIPLLQSMTEWQEIRGHEWRCRGFIKAELFTEEQAMWMHRAGFRNVLCGFESGSDKILKNINKQATKDDNTRAMEISHKYGLEMKALMSLGHPGESERTIQDTLDWLLEVQPQDFDCTIITAYPGSPYYDQARHLHDDVWAFDVNGDRLYMQDIDYTKVEDFYKGSIDGYRSYVWTDELTSEELVDQRNAVEYAARGALKIPFYEAKAPEKFEASMGMLPGSIYRRSN